MQATALLEVTRVYDGSDGEATKALYMRLESVGPAGCIAAHLMRAQKNSARAKVYRGGDGRSSYRSLAYERKQWAMGQLAKTLTSYADGCGIRWGWGLDPEQPVHRDVLFVDLPTGQVSFHTGKREVGPDYPGKWDGRRGVSPQRVCSYAAQVLASQAELV